MKTDSVFKRAYNDALDLIAGLRDGDVLPSEVRLSLRLEVSRTTVRKVMAALGQGGLVSGEPGARRVVLNGGLPQRYPAVETVAQSVRVESRFLEWMQRAEARPGTKLNELDLARRFGVATTTIRDFLRRFSRFGLVERRPNGRWQLRGFTPEFARELFEIRALFELRSALLFAATDPSDPIWDELRELRQAHVDLLAQVGSGFARFPDLDSAFHRLVIRALPNRFIDSFFDVITMIFHYHYQWNRVDERQRNETALGEHLVYIDALLSRDGVAVERACRAHLASAQRTLLASTRTDNHQQG